MRHCASEGCPILRRHGRPAEFQDEVSHCLDCGAPLTPGPAPEPEPVEDQRVRPPVAIAGPTAIAGAYDTMADAYVARGQLESEGIRARDLSRAREILAEDRSADLEALGLRPEESERCPRCDSPWVRSPRLGGWSDFVLSILSGFFLRLPVPPSSRWRICPEGGFRWRLRRGRSPRPAP